MNTLYMRRAFAIVFALLCGIVLSHMAASLANAQCCESGGVYWQHAAATYGNFFDCPNTTYVRPVNTPQRWGYGHLYGPPSYCPPPTTTYQSRAPQITITTPPVPERISRPSTQPSDEDEPRILPLHHEEPAGKEPKPIRRTVPAPPIDWRPAPEDVSPRPIIARLR